MFIHKGIDKRSLISSYYNSLSLAFSEIVGRSYGGGVLELMPSEAVKILIPYQKENADLLDEIDTMMRKKRILIRYSRKQMEYYYMKNLGCLAKK